MVEPANNEDLIQNDQTMRYRPLGKTGLTVSALSMGCMRLGDDQEVNTATISRAIELGVNYFETSRGYCGGRCQQRVAPGLKEKTKGVIVSGKRGIDVDTTAHVFRAEIELQLENLGLTHFKFFQVGWFSWEKVRHLLKPGGALDALRRAKAEGLIQHVGFTGHDTPENFIKCIETGLFECITVPYNLIDRTYEPTIRRAGELGIGVVAMCALGGGVLAPTSDKLNETMQVDMPGAEMALRFVLSNPDISTACSGMAAVEQVEQNAAAVKAFDPETDSIHDVACEGVQRLRDAFGQAFCTACQYCMPCPQGVSIPSNMGMYRNWKCFGFEDGTRAQFRRFPEGIRADQCNQCGECEEKCPNGIQIRQRLRELLALRQ